MEKCEGCQGDAPLAMPPPLGERGGHTPNLWQKKSDEFLHPDRIKSNTFLHSHLFKLPAFRKTIASLKAYTVIIQARDAGNDSRNPMVYPKRNNQSEIDNEHRNI
jgi:hypothetical protein